MNSEMALPTRSSAYEIGRKRPDGKFNVWCLMATSPHWSEWIIVHVADTKRRAWTWIHERTKA